MSRRSHNDDWDTQTRNPRRRVGLVTLLGAVIAVVIGAGWLAGDSMPADSTEPEGDVVIERATAPLQPAQVPLLPPPSGPPPAVVGGTYDCPAPFTIGAYTIDGRQLAYPRGHPARPAHDVAPDLCSDNVEELAEAGYVIPNPPQGYAFVDGVYLRVIADALQGSCASAAAELGFQVPCPTVIPALPSGWLPLCTDLPPGGNRCIVKPDRGFLIRVDDVPLLPGRSVQLTTFSLGATAAKGGYEQLVVCGRGDEPVATPQPLSIVTACGWGPPWNGEGGFPHQGLVTERWRHEGVDVAVSLGDDDMNLDRARQRIVEGLYWVGPDQQTTVAD